MSVTSYQAVNIYRCFKGLKCLNLEGQAVHSPVTTWSWRWRQYNPSKHQYLPANVV